MSEVTAEEYDGLEALSSDIGGIEDSIPDRLAKDTAEWLCEHGIRTDDQAMVFHFYPKRQIPGVFDKEGNPVAGWSEDYHMDRRLDQALKMFDPEDLNCKFIETHNSFNVIVGGLGAALDPWPLVEKFFSRIEDCEV